MIISQIRQKPMENNAERKQFSQGKWNRKWQEDGLNEFIAKTVVTNSRH